MKVRDVCSPGISQTTYRMVGHFGRQTRSLGTSQVAYWMASNLERQIRSPGSCPDASNTRGRWTNQIRLPLDKYPDSPQVYKSSFAGRWEKVHQCSSAGRSSARRLTYPAASRFRRHWIRTWKKNWTYQAASHFRRHMISTQRKNLTYLSRGS